MLDSLLGITWFIAEVGQFLVIRKVHMTTPQTTVAQTLKFGSFPFPMSEHATPMDCEAENAKAFNIANVLPPQILDIPDCGVSLKCCESVTSKHI